MKIDFAELIKRFLIFKIKLSLQLTTQNCKLKNFENFQITYQLSNLRIISRYKYIQ